MMQTLKGYSRVLFPPSGIPLVRKAIRAVIVGGLAVELYALGSERAPQVNETVKKRCFECSNDSEYFSKPLAVFSIVNTTARNHCVKKLSAAERELRNLVGSNAPLKEIKAAEKKLQQFTNAIATLDKDGGLPLQSRINIPIVCSHPVQHPREEQVSVSDTVLAMFFCTKMAEIILQKDRVKLKAELIVAQTMIVCVADSMGFIGLPLFCGLHMVRNLLADNFAVIDETAIDALAMELMSETPFVVEEGIEIFKVLNRNDFCVLWAALLIAFPRRITR